MSRAASWSQCTWLSTRWVRQGRASPICSASCQPFLRCAPLSKASRYSPACRRGSGRTNKGPSRCFKTSSASRHASTPSATTNLCHPENRQIRGTGGEPDGKLNCSTMDRKLGSLLLGFGVVTNCAFSTCYQERRWRLYLPMLTSRQPCCRNFNWLAAKGRTLRVASLRDE